ncbi:hypothetical protein F2P79_002141 [Pimephales promelas]|nr:hypothetical protein F2P79_002141 [Pimephales promelas]
MKSVDIPMLSVIPPLHVRSTGTHDGWLLRNSIVLSVTSIFLPIIPHRGTGEWHTCQPKKVIISQTHRDLLQ